MKTRIGLILAAIILAAAMSISSCTKQEPDPVTETPTRENPTEKKADTPELQFDGETSVLAYIGEPVKVSFKVSGEGKSSCKVEFTSDSKSEVEGSYNAASGVGYCNITLNDSASHTFSLVKLTVKGDGKDRNYSVKVTAYYLDITVKDIVLPGSAGADARLEYSIDTNIPDFVPAISTDAPWLTLEGNTVTATQENTSGETRTAEIIFSDKDGHLEPVTLMVSQESLAPQPKPDCVNFADWAFKKACLEIADSDKNGEISFAEAESVQELVIVGKGIKDLTGLDAFKNVWKLDARNNDIEDADILKELHYLHWLDLQGNNRLRTFDLTGCTIYFDHCWFECTQQLQYKLLRHQVGIAGGGDWYGKLTSDPWCKHSKHIRDERQTIDWSHQDNLIKIKSHTKTWVKNGQEMEYAICVSGIGYLDVDIADGTFKRMMDETIENLKAYSELAEKWDYIDIYYLEHMTDNRYKYMIPRNGQGPGDEDYDCAASGWLREYHSLQRKMWDKIYGDYNGINKILIPIDVNIHALPHQDGYAGLGINSVLAYFASTKDFQGKSTQTKPYLPLISIRVSPYMDDENEVFYSHDMTITNTFNKELFPIGSFKESIDILF